MTTALRRGDAVTASTYVGASPELVYAVVSDVTRIPEWSPECVRCEWRTDVEFQGWNRRGLGRWSTRARVEVASPGHEFAFVVRIGAKDFTRWSYRMEPSGDGTRLTEQVSMCMDLPLGAVLFERWLLRVKDRRTDLEGNLEQSLRRLRRLVESEPQALSRALPVTGTE